VCCVSVSVEGNFFRLLKTASTKWSLTELVIEKCWFNVVFWRFMIQTSWSSLKSELEIFQWLFLIVGNFSGFGQNWIKFNQNSEPVRLNIVQISSSLLSVQRLRFCNNYISCIRLDNIYSIMPLKLNCLTDLTSHTPNGVSRIIGWKYSPGLA
jgi:hypothetical protein